MKLKEYISELCKNVGDSLVATLELEIEVDGNLNVIEGGGQKINMTVHNIK